MRADVPLNHIKIKSSHPEPLWLFPLVLNLDIYCVQHLTTGHISSDLIWALGLHPLLASGLLWKRFSTHALKIIGLGHF